MPHFANYKSLVEFYLVPSLPNRASPTHWDSAIACYITSQLDLCLHERVLFLS